MFRLHLTAFALICTLAACSPAPESAKGGASAPAMQTANQDAARGDVTAEKILRDIVGRVVKITEVGGDSQPTEWTFDAGEFRQMEILDRKTTPTSAAITVFMTTRNNPRPDEDAVQVSGRLILHYQRKGGEWVLTTIENLSFRYTIGVAT
jgi:hypothetical protein